MKSLKLLNLPKENLFSIARKLDYFLHRREKGDRPEESRPGQEKGERRAEEEPRERGGEGGRHGKGRGRGAWPHRCQPQGEEREGGERKSTPIKSLKLYAKSKRQYGKIRCKPLTVTISL